MQSHQLTVAFLLGMLACLCAAVAFAEEPTLIAKFASGDRFYVQPESVHPVGGGRLEYQVVGTFNASAPGRMITLNQVDCNTGQYLSYLHAWRYDASGRLIDEQALRPHAVNLAPNSKLYGILKDACRELAPEISTRW